MKHIYAILACMIVWCDLAYGQTKNVSGPVTGNDLTITTPSGTLTIPAINVVGVSLHQERTNFWNGIGVGATGVLLEASSSGAMSLTGIGNGTDENLVLNFNASNAITASSSTGVTRLIFSEFSVTIGGAAAASDLRFLEPSGSGTNYSEFKAQAQAANITYILPAAIGTSGQFLKTTVSGTTATLSWDDAAGSGSVATDAIFDAAGDLVQGTGANTSARLAIGTAGQLLQVNAGATAAEWTSNISIPGSISTGVGGSVAGYIALGQGTAPSAGTTNVTFYAPTSVTSHTRRVIGVAGTGLSMWTNTAGDMVETLVTPGTGVNTALAVNVGSAGAFVTFNGAGGTPSSLTLTNGTGLPIGGITGLGTGVGTALAAAVNGASGFLTTDGTASPTNKTFDAAATGNVLKKFDYLILSHPHVFGSAVTQQTTVTNQFFGQALFADDVETNNYIEYVVVVPPDIDLAVDLTATFHFVTANADTADHDYVISFASVAASADKDGTLGDAINLAYTADASGAADDAEATAETTLTGWRSAMTAGNRFVIRITRDGDDGTNDASTVDSYSGPLVIKYGITQ